MSLLETLAIAIALGTDAFSVAIVCGIQQFNHKSIVRISLVTAFFHIFMPLIGLYGGHFVQDILEYFFKYNGKVEALLNIIGSGLLMLIGFYMIIEQFINKEEELCNFNLAGWGLAVLAFSVSIDSLSVGISLGMLGHINFIVVAMIGATAGLMMASGLIFGSRVGHFLGEKAQIIGGTALVLLGIHFSGLF